MKDLQIGDTAPDFILLDVNDHAIKLSDFRGKFVILALLRGFT
ncbi:MAG TPA: hypothetical protein VMW28_00965 [Pelolinea sp.]|nr:hypothetical protein [Pelolinea sp.]